MGGSERQERGRWSAPRPWMRKVVVLFGAALLTIVPAVPALAAAGDPDLTFSQDGKLTTDFGSEGDVAHAVAVQSDGRIVVAGQALSASSGDYEFALVRYLVNGDRDPTFGRNGKVTTGFARGSVTFNDVVNGVAVQPADGKIVAAGWAGPYLALARYTANGSLDPAFGGGDGKVLITFGFAGTGYNVAHDVVIQPADGRIVVAGEAWNGSDYKFCAARFNTDGSLDSTFDGDGKVTTTFGAGVDVAYGLVIQPADGKIVVAGTAWNGSNFDFAVARYDTFGTLDPGFAGNGKKKVGFPSGEDYAQGVALTPASDAIVAVGRTFDGVNSNVALIRLDPSGSVLGKVMTDLGSFDSGQDVAIQPNGGIVVAGLAGDDFGLARYKPNLALDPTFGVGGKVTTDFGSDGASAWGLALQPSDGRIVAVGENYSSVFGSDFAVARYLGA